MIVDAAACAASHRLGAVKGVGSCQKRRDGGPAMKLREQVEEISRSSCYGMRWQEADFFVSRSTIKQRHNNALRRSGFQLRHYVLAVAPRQGHREP